jgi:hypothetical protein
MLHYTHHWVPDNPHQVRVDKSFQYTGRRRDREKKRCGGEDQVKIFSLIGKSASNSNAKCSD